VRDAKGQAIAGAWVEIRPSKVGAVDDSTFDGPPSQSTRSNADGEYEFDGIQPGVHLITVVACETVRSDAEMQQLAGTVGKVPADVAIGRLLRRFGSGKHAPIENGDLALALRPSGSSPLHARLTGDFAPDRFGYEVVVNRTKPIMLGPGTHTVTVTMSEETASPDSFAVPLKNGALDFGLLDVDPGNSLSVESFPLDSEDAAMRDGCSTGSS
jgi:hypothetical protein